MGHNINNLFAIAVYKKTTMRDLDLVTYPVATIVDGTNDNIT